MDRLSEIFIVIDVIGRYDVQHTINRCPKCKNTLAENTQYKYKGLGHSDIEHAYFAVYARVSTFYSTDKSFNALADDSDFSSMTIITL